MLANSDTHEFWVQVHDVRTQEVVTPRLMHQRPILNQASAFSPDGTKLATADTMGLLKIVDANTGSQLTPTMKHSGMVRMVEFNSTGDHILAVARSRVYLWDVATGNQLCPPLEHRKMINQAKFSPDGKRILIASEDGTARVWDFEPFRGSVDALRELAELLSGQQVFHGNSLIRVETEALMDSFERL